MDYTSEQLSKIAKVIDKLSAGNDAVKQSPSTRVMAINLLISYEWDLEKVLRSLN